MGGALGGRRHLPVRPDEDARRDLLDRHAAADGERLAAHGLGVRVRADRHDRPVPADARPRGLLPDGLGRQRPRRPSAGCRTTTACGATRRLPYDPDFVAAGEARRSERSRSRRQNFVELCDRLVVEDEQKFEELWRRLGLSVDWAMTYTTIGERSRARVAARVPAQPRARRGVPVGGADALGRRRPHRGRAGRARGPRAARRVPRDRVPRRRRRAPTS